MFEAYPWRSDGGQKSQKHFDGVVLVAMLCYTFLNFLIFSFGANQPTSFPWNKKGKKSTHVPRSSLLLWLEIAGPITFSGKVQYATVDLNFITAHEKIKWKFKRVGRTIFSSPQK
jgi:hypothetical protein